MQSPQDGLHPPGAREPVICRVSLCRGSVSSPPWRGQAPGGPTPLRSRLGVEGQPRALSGAPLLLVPPRGHSWRRQALLHQQTGHTGVGTPGRPRPPQSAPISQPTCTPPPRVTPPSTGASRQAEGPWPPPGRGAQPRAGPSPSPGDGPYCLSVCHCGYWSSISHSDMSRAQNQLPSPTRCPLLEAGPVPSHRPPSILGAWRAQVSSLPKHQAVWADPGCSRLSAGSRASTPWGADQHSTVQGPPPACAHTAPPHPRTAGRNGLLATHGTASLQLGSDPGRWAGGRSAGRPCLESPAPSTPARGPHLPASACSLCTLLSCPWALRARTSWRTCSRARLPAVRGDQPPSKCQAAPPVGRLRPEADLHLSSLPCSLPEPGVLACHPGPSSPRPAPA